MQLHAFITGKVQNVSFRSGTKAVADSLHLTGWVKNLKDKRVEVLAEGSKESLEELLAWLKKGTPLSIVKKLDYKYAEKDGELESFNII